MHDSNGGLVTQPAPETEACIRLGKFTFTHTGLMVDASTGEPTLAEWMSAGEALLVLVNGLQFAVGDWLNYGEAKYGELAAQAIDARDWAEETVRNYRWVAAKVPPQNRMMQDGLSFAHHQVVAALPPGKQRKWLEKAAADRENIWPKAKLKAAISGKGKEEQAPPRYWVLVEVKDETDQDMFIKEMRQSGRVAKAVTRHGDEEE